MKANNSTNNYGFVLSNGQEMKPLLNETGKL